MGIPLVKTKLLHAYSIGAAFGGMSGAFFGTYYTMVNAAQFAFGFSIFILAMVIIGGLGSIWGAVVREGLALGYINNYLIPDVLNSIPSKLGFNFQLTQVDVGIFRVLLVIMMLLRPQGLIPERRHRLGPARIAAEDAQLVETPGPRWRSDVSSTETPTPPPPPSRSCARSTSEMSAGWWPSTTSRSTFPQHSIVSLIQQNGAGKTTCSTC